MILTIFQDTRPGSIAITFNDRVCASEFVRLLRIKCCVNSTEDYTCSLLACQPADFIATQCIARVNPNSNNIPSRNASDIQLLQCFVNDHRGTKAGGCSSGEYIEPAGCDDTDAEGPVTRIDEVNFQFGSFWRVWSYCISPLNGAIVPMGSPSSIGVNRLVTTTVTTNSQPCSGLHSSALFPALVGIAPHRLRTATQES